MDNWAQWVITGLGALNFLWLQRTLNHIDRMQEKLASLPLIQIELTRTAERVTSLERWRGDISGFLASTGYRFRDDDPNKTPPPRSSTG